MKNYYAVLGVPVGASRGEIHSAYRQKVKTYHPDYYPGDPEPFMDVQEAYSVLTDAARRRDYDRRLGQTRTSTRSSKAEPLAAEPLTRRRAEPLAERDEGPVDFGDVSLTNSFETYRPSFDEIFDRLWRNFSSLAPPKTEQLRGLTAEVAVTRDQARRGGHVRIMVPARAVCPTCRGHGGIGMYECWRCAGEGAIAGEYPVLVSFPEQMPDNYVVQMPLSRFGIHNLYLNVYFRVSATDA